MTHYVSVDRESGRNAVNMVKAPLADVLKEALLKSPERKEDCWLVSNGYSDERNVYTRAEFNFTSIDTILLDCDNGKDANPETWNADVVEEFKKEHEPYSYFLWETASSTATRPKFRAILLLDKKIPWINEPEKFTKHAIQQQFARWVDDKASWFFTPTKGKLGTFVAHNGKPYPADAILSLVELERAAWELKQPTKAEAWDRQNVAKWERNPQGWRFLPTVEKCLGGLSVGERDNSLCAACYAMDKNGYRESIPEFLDECVVDSSLKVKWLRRYSR